MKKLHLLASKKQVRKLLLLIKQVKDKEIKLYTFDSYKIGDFSFLSDFLEFHHTTYVFVHIKSAKLIKKEKRASSLL